MQDAKRSILDRVVHGTLTPEEAALELELLDPSPTATRPLTGDAGSAEDEADAEPLSSDLLGVRISNQMGSVTVLGDPTIRDVVAEGPHLARREGDTMVIEVPGGGFTDRGFHFSRPGREGVEGRRLVVRMNPALALDASVLAGSLKVHQLGGTIRAFVQAGSTTIEDCDGPYEVSVSAGSFKGRTRVARGRSTIRCEAGSVKLQLLEGSSCCVRAETTMGKISLPDGGHRSSLGLGDRAEVTIGGGAATLEIRSSMGSVLVSTDR